MAAKKVFFCGKCQDTGVANIEEVRGYEQFMDSVFSAMKEDGVRLSGSRPRAPHEEACDSCPECMSCGVKLFLHTELELKDSTHVSNNHFLLPNCGVDPTEG